MAGPDSISRDQIAKAVRDSVEKVLQGRGAAFTQPHTIGFVAHPPHWIGIIYNNPQTPIPFNIDTSKPKELKPSGDDAAQKLADDIVEATKSVPGLKVGTPAVFRGRDHVTIGFLPQDAQRDEQGHLGSLADLRGLGQ